MLAQPTFPTRPLPLAGLIAGFSLVVAVPAAPAQSLFTLGVPDATETALRSDDLSWNALRHNGLILSVQRASDLPDTERGDLELVMFALIVENGRAVDSWTSPAFDVRGGVDGRISGRYLPAIQDARVTGVSATRQAVDAGRMIEVAKQAGAAGAAASLPLPLPRDMVRGRTLVMFVAPADGGGGFQTNLLFARAEPANDL